MFWCTKSVKCHFRWGIKPRDQKKDTGNDCDVISGVKQISLTFSYFLMNNALLYHFLANWLAHIKKMTEKSVFREAWSPEMTSQPFPVSCFWCRGFVPHRKWNLSLLVHQKSLTKKFLLYLSTDKYSKNLGRFNLANRKKNCHIHLKSRFLKRKFKWDA